MATTAELRDGAWGKLGWAPPRHCHRCHKRGHRWEKCKKRPDGAVPDFVENKQGRGNRGRDRGDAHAAEGDHGSEFGELAMATGVGGEASVAAAHERDGWWVDSCASHNFTPCASDFRGPL